MPSQIHPRGMPSFVRPTAFESVTMMHELSSTELRFSFDAMTIGLVLVAALVLRVFPGIWDVTVGRIDRHRIHALDGARGLLTTWVLCHHMMMLRNTDAHGVWQAPPGAFGALLTSGFFVAPFFMLTAMLFGGRLLARPGQLAVGPFLIGRAFRLLPAYMLALAIFVACAFALSGWTLQRPAFAVVKEIGRWMLFDFVPRYDINGVDLASHYGILWTLKYEILFYLSLPVLAFVQRITRSRLVLVAGLAALSYIWWPFAFFTAGAVAAILTRLSSNRAKIVWQILALAGIFAVIAFAGFRITYSWVQAICLIPIMTCLALEVTMVAPLKWRPFRLIGEASYSNYVLHGPIGFFLATFVVDPNVGLAMSFVPRTLWLVAFGTVALAGAMASFVLVEMPCIRLGGRLAKHFAAPRARDIPGAHLAT